jgi:hypothetical protein
MCVNLELPKCQNKRLGAGTDSLNIEIFAGDVSALLVITNLIVIEFYSLRAGLCAMNRNRSTGKKTELIRDIMFRDVGAFGRSNLDK